MRRPIIAGNWKMNALVPEAVKLAGELKQKLSNPHPAEVILAPPFTALYPVKQILADAADEIQLAGQNIYSAPAGAYTGEISASMLKDVGCAYVILGHSERRHVFGEPDCLINQKIKAARSSGLKVIFCVGETLEQRENNQTTQTIREQLKKGLEDLSAEDLDALVIAYEPVWAIGTGKNASPEQAQDVHRFIRGYLLDFFGNEVSLTTRILYGGSVNPNNSGSLLAKEDVDGALVGGASLIADSFYAIIKTAY
ncbi:MAG: triose-phosphate isomerase [Nitrospinales bacterium]